MNNFLKRAPTRPDPRTAVQPSKAPLLEPTLAPETARRVVTISVPLPSQGVFYPERQASVQVSPLTVRQVRNVHAASKASGSARERTFASVIQQSVHDFDVLKMTIDDYKFIMYWIRMNSYPNSPFTVQWQYWDDKNKKDVEVTSYATMAHFDVKQLNRNMEPDPRFSYPTVGDSIDYLQIDDPSDKYIAYYAQVLAGPDLSSKVSKIQSEDAEILNDIKSHLVQFAHGVSEYVNVQDTQGKEPSKIFKIPLEMELKDFYP